MIIPDPGHPTPRRGKDCAPLPPKEREVRWACLAIFFLALGLGDCLHWGPGVGILPGWSVQPKGVCALALTHFN